MIRHHYRSIEQGLVQRYYTTMEAKKFLNSNLKSVSIKFIRCFTDVWQFYMYIWNNVKKKQKPMYSYGNFSAFFLWSPLGNCKKKSCLNKLKFGEASRNLQRRTCWKFKLSISLGTQKSAKTPPAVGKMIRPFRPILGKVHIFWEGHKLLRNLHLTFVLCRASQK